MLRILFFLAIFVPGLVAAIFSRFNALLLYLWVAMFRPQDWVWTDISQFRPSLVAGLALAVPAVLTGTFPVVFHPLALGAWLFLAVSAFAQTGAVRPDVGWMWLDYLVRLLLVAFLIAPLAKTPRRVLLVVAVVSGSLVFHSAKAGLGALLSGGAIYQAGLGGSFGDNNDYAVGTATAMFMLVAVGQTRRGLLRLGILAAAGPLSALTIVSLFSRSGFLALAAGAIAFVILQRWRHVFVAMVGTLVVIGLLFAVAPAGYQERLETIGTGTTSTGRRADGGRLYFWGLAVDMVAAHPFGVGLFNFPEQFDAFDTSGGQFGHQRSVHNSALQALAETGYLGGLTWASVMLGTVGVLFRVRRRSRDTELPAETRTLSWTLANGMIASMSAFLVGGLFLSQALNDLAWLIVGMTVALDRLVAKPRSRPTFAPLLGGPWPASST